MVPPRTEHSAVSISIGSIFKEFLKRKPCKVFSDVKVIFSKKDRVMPDIVVVCDKNKIKDGKIYGAPDLIVEVLSPGTNKYDRGYKKDMYGKYGVKEYWIADTKNRTVEIYINNDGVLDLIKSYSIFEENEYKKLRPEEKAEAVTEFSPIIFPEMIVSLHDIFAKLV
jgi:Uma2 family endonuclease